jgi:hypothetical protein
MEPLIAAAALLTITLVAVLAPSLGVDSRRDEPTWPGAPLSGRETRRFLRYGGETSPPVDAPLRLVKSGARARHGDPFGHLLAVRIRYLNAAGADHDSGDRHGRRRSCATRLTDRR